MKRAYLLLVLAGLPLAGFAQQQPLTEHMLGGHVSTPQAGVPATAQEAPRATAEEHQPTIEIGDSSDDRTLGRTTHALLSAQANGTYAGRRLPIPGDQASASYKRYLHSFEHEIPEFFEAKVQQPSDGGR